MAQANSTPTAGFNFRPPARRWTSVVEMLVVLVLFLAGVIWFGGAFPNRDALWFYAKFDHQPAYVRVYHYGETRELWPGDPGFDALVGAVNAEIPQHTGYVESLQPRDASWESYALRGYAVELVYSAPILVHTRQFFPETTRLLIAIDGSYNYVTTSFQQPGAALLFRGSAEKWLPNGLVLKSVDQVRAAAEAALAGQ